MTRRAIYPGTFDPITNGHVNLAIRGAQIFDELIIAVAESSKTTVFTMQERIDMINKVVGQEDRIRVVGFDGLLIDFAEQSGARVVIRGLRAVSDFEYEFQLAWMNRQLNRSIETLFFAPSEDNAFVSASLVKEIAGLGGDTSKFVHPVVLEALKRKLNT